MVKFTTLPVLTVFLVISAVNSIGLRSYGELCRFTGQITSLFNHDHEERTCNSEEGLICTGTCTCPPGRVWDTSASFFGGVRPSGKGCAIPVGRPCFSRSGNHCVSNSHCTNSLCLCKPKYKRSGQHCVKVIGEGPADAGNLSGFFGHFNTFNNNNSPHHDYPVSNSNNENLDNEQAGSTLNNKHTRPSFDRGLSSSSRIRFPE